ncbi:DedA family protein [Falsirhodobacter halotolerans]|uniref:DedA family protein n=1 Tax=Falsirhodobacter halotolerans TaxID=1146892 RepID=UPI001FD18B88|nr:DedA family protein [Falsirhodobacter halotolerans]MCJ8140797.1 DedA family protein [Falsirhodobacter halotolerans]
MSLETLVSDYGTFGLFAGSGFEGETVAMLGGVLAHRGLLDVWAAILAVAAGSFLTDQIFFLAGRKFRNSPRVRRLQAGPAGARVLRAFHRRRDLFVFGFRFAYGLRMASAVTIGTTAYPWGRFALLNAAAALSWAATFVALGYLCGQAIETLFGHLRAHIHYPLAIVAVGLCSLALLWVMKRRRTGG